MNINSKATRVLIYGDSLTWGRIANTPYRYDTSIRFTSVIQEQLGNDYEVIEEGLRGRMAYGENPYQEGKDGWNQFVPIYLSHLPVDILIIFLGTNDTNDKSNKNSEEISKNIEQYIDKAKKLSKANEMKEPKIALICSPMVDESVLKPNTMFAGAYERMKDLPSQLERVAIANKCHFFDTNKYITVCKEDGVHLDKDANIKLGTELALFIKSFFEGN